MTPARRARHILTPAEEHAFLIEGSRLYNAGEYFECHEQWEEIWRRSSGARCELVRGLIQMAVGYEHLRRDNPTGSVSLLRQAARRLTAACAVRGTGDLPRSTRMPALAMAYLAAGDARRLAADPQLRLRDLEPPRVWVVLSRRRAQVPGGAIRIPIPRA